jgi:hypothetical protein
MAQETFTPVEGSTHLDARNTYNANADDAEARLTALESNTGGGGAVDSVNTQTGVVVLDADDISDATTTNKFATQAQLDKADSALQPSEPTLESVTSNGATTTNHITVGGKFATGTNVASGGNALAIGGTGNTASADGSEVLGGDGSTASGQGSSVIGGSNHQNAANWTATIGGLNQNVASGAVRGAILAGFGHNLNHSDSVIIGGNTITSDANNTVFVPNLNVKDGFKMPTGASNTYVLTSDANGVGTWQAAAGGPAGPSGTILSGTTANATPTEIFVDGTSPNRVDVATGSTITFSALVAARSATESAGYKIEGVIKNDAGVALVGVVAKTVFAEEDIAWDITVTAANNALTFIVTGDSADSVSWEVTLNKIEAT